MQFSLLSGLFVSFARFFVSFAVLKGSKRKGRRRFRKGRQVKLHQCRRVTMLDVDIGRWLDSQVEELPPLFPFRLKPGFGSGTIE